MTNNKCITYLDSSMDDEYTDQIFIDLEANSNNKNVKFNENAME